jgi:hypothetical protein
MGRGAAGTEQSVRSGPVMGGIAGMGHRDPEKTESSATRCSCFALLRCVAANLNIKEIHVDHEAGFIHGTGLNLHALAAYQGEFRADKAIDSIDRLGTRRSAREEDTIRKLGFTGRQRNFAARHTETAADLRSDR